MLKQTVKNLPNSPGIYQYFDANNKLLYIGKAKSLKNRVKSYFRFEGEIAPALNLSLRIHKMISEAVRLEYMVLQSEHDALILENSLIKQLKPKYNILLRDDKTYPYIYINLAEDFPRFEITRKIVKGSKIKYFGPFSSSSRAILDSLYLIFPLVQKKACIKGKKACLFYQINRCKAPCENKISKEDYLQIVQNAFKAINDRKFMLKELEEKMYEASKILNFEEASRLRDMQESIKNTLHVSQIDIAKLEDFDIFSVYIQERTACALRLFIREGKVVSSTHSILHSNDGFDKDELYERLLFEYYAPQMPYLAKNILIADEIKNKEAIEIALKQKCNHNFNIQAPKIGDKKNLCDLALLNAKELIFVDKNRSKLSLLDSLQSLFELEALPQNIEVFDNSHLSGQATVGAMIVCANEKFIKSKYRHYHLHEKDEYGQMRELLTQRALRFEKDSPPELWILDGGETLRKLAEDIVQSIGANIDIIAIAKEKVDAKANRSKGSANDILYSKNGKFFLLTSDVRLQFVQRLRDEAHRFAISFHRKVRDKKTKNSSSFKLAGLSDAIIKKLIGYYGSFEATKEADIETLNKLFSSTMAKKVLEVMNNLKKENNA